MKQRLPHPRKTVSCHVGRPAKIVRSPEGDSPPASKPLTLLEARRFRRAEAGTRRQAARRDRLARTSSIFLSWRYRDPKKQLAERLGIDPAHFYLTGPVGGRESPIRYLARGGPSASQRGECSVARGRAPAKSQSATKAGARRQSICHGRRSRMTSRSQKRRRGVSRNPDRESSACSDRWTVYSIFTRPRPRHIGPEPPRGDGARIRQSLVDLRDRRSENPTPG